VEPNVDKMDQLKRDEMDLNIKFKEERKVDEEDYKKILISMISR
jgi:hypothetical protein